MVMVFSPPTVNPRKSPFSSERYSPQFYRALLQYCMKLTRSSPSRLPNAPGDSLPSISASRHSHSQALPFQITPNPDPPSPIQNTSAVLVRMGIWDTLVGVE